MKGPPVLLCLFIVLGWPAVGRAGPPWTRDQGHFYVNVSYSRLSTSEYYAPDFSLVPINPFTQEQAGIYGEVGLVSRWLTATVDGTVFRRNHIQDQGITQGVGDWRVGLWTGALIRPVRLSFGLTLGIPVGDPRPDAGQGADPEAQLIAHSLPTGNGDYSLEGRVSLGYSFRGLGGWPRYYLIAEAGYWLHTQSGYADDFVYRLQLGTNLPFRGIDRFWLNLRVSGIESFASNQEASRNATGLGPGVTYVSPGFEVLGRIVAGLGASFGLDGVVRGRSIAAGYQIKVATSYEW